MLCQAHLEERRSRNEDLPSVFTSDMHHVKLSDAKSSFHVKRNSVTLERECCGVEGALDGTQGGLEIVVGLWRVVETEANEERITSKLDDIATPRKDQIQERSKVFTEDGAHEFCAFRAALTEHLCHWREATYIKEGNNGSNWNDLGFSNGRRAVSDMPMKDSSGNKLLICPWSVSCSGGGV